MGDINVFCQQTWSVFSSEINKFITLGHVQRQRLSVGGVGGGCWRLHIPTIATTVLPSCYAREGGGGVTHTGFGYPLQNGVLEKGGLSWTQELSGGGCQRGISGWGCSC